MAIDCDAPGSTKVVVPLIDSNAEMITKEEQNKSDQKKSYKTTKESRDKTKRDFIEWRSSLETLLPQSIIVGRGLLIIIIVIIIIILQRCQR